MRGSARSIMAGGPYAHLSDLFFVVAFSRDCKGVVTVHSLRMVWRERMGHPMLTWPTLVDMGGVGVGVWLPVARRGGVRGGVGMSARLD